MSTILILVAFFFDYKSDKKQFKKNLLGGFKFLGIFAIVVFIICFVFSGGLLYAIFSIPVVIFAVLILKNWKNLANNK